MQKVKVADVISKSGTNDKGPYTNTRITGEDGAVFGSFHDSAATIMKGDLIELEPVVKGKYVNFDVWNMIEKAPEGSAQAPSNGGGDRFKRNTEGIAFEYDLKAQAEAIKNASIEAQTAFNGIIELAKAGVVGEDFPAVYAEALGWARAKMAANRGVSFQQQADDMVAEFAKSDTKAPPAATRAKSSAPAAKPSGNGPAPASQPAPAGSGQNGDNPTEFPHIGALLKWCTTKGISLADFKTIVGIQDAELPKLNVMEAYQMVKDHLANPIIPDKA